MVCISQIKYINSVIATAWMEAAHLVHFVYFMYGVCVCVCAEARS